MKGLKDMQTFYIYTFLCDFRVRFFLLDVKGQRVMIFVMKYIIIHSFITSLLNADDNVVYLLAVKLTDENFLTAYLRKLKNKMNILMPRLSPMMISVADSILKQTKLSTKRRILS